jgi:hypothetical protein
VSPRDQLGAFYEPRAVARRGDPGTSWAAAASVTGIRESQARVLSVVREFGPLTDERLLSILASYGRPYTPSGARTRRSELVALGLVRDSRQRQRLSTGRMAILWEVDPGGGW